MAELIDGSALMREQRDAAVSSAPIIRLHGGGDESAEDQLAVEEPLEIQLAFGPAGARQVKSISVTMRTPGHDEELAVGFLMTESVIADADEIEAIHSVEGNVRGGARNTVRVELACGIEVKLASLERNFYVTSSCGVCGKASLLALQAVCPPRRSNNFSIDAKTLYALPARLREVQGIFDRTGGLHAAALFDSAGTLHSVREDVGRHNALDKLLGAEFLAGRTPLTDRLLLLSGRASFELLQKAVMAGIPMIASVGAPSSLAVSVAREFDVTLAGFLREQGCNLYHGAEWVTTGS